MFEKNELNQYIVETDHSLGSGDIAKVAGLSKWGDQHSVYGRYHRGYEIDKNEHIIRGESLEAGLGNMYFFKYCAGGENEHS